jgi:hypothetical protein
LEKNNNISNRQYATISVYWPFQSALQVSGVSYAHPQEHLTVFTAFGITPTLMPTGDTVKVEVNINRHTGRQQRRYILTKGVNTVKCS